MGFLKDSSLELNWMFFFVIRFGERERDRQTGGDEQRDGRAAERERQGGETNRYREREKEVVREGDRQREREK